MSNRISLDVVGAKALSDKLGRLEPKVWRKPMRKAMSLEMKGVRSQMRAKVPKRLGRLRRSIATQSWFIERNRGALDIFVRTGPTYRGPGRKRGFPAHFVELGTKHSAAKPFVKPVFDSAKATLPSKFTAALRAIIGL